MAKVGELASAPSGRSSEDVSCHEIVVISVSALVMIHDDVVLNPRDLPNLPLDRQHTTVNFQILMLDGSVLLVSWKILVTISKSHLVINMLLRLLQDSPKCAVDLLIIHNTQVANGYYFKVDMVSNTCSKI